MDICGWKYYYHAAIPTTAPHISADLQPIADRAIWKIEGGRPLLARWTSDWDCTDETNWWYVIKDTVFDIDKLKSKRRYEINKGMKNFQVELIDPKESAEEIYAVAKSTFSVYPQ